MLKHFHERSVGITGPEKYPGKEWMMACIKNMHDSLWVVHMNIMEIGSYWCMQRRVKVLSPGLWMQFIYFLIVLCVGESKAPPVLYHSLRRGARNTARHMITVILLFLCVKGSSNTITCILY